MKERAYSACVYFSLFLVLFILTLIVDTLKIKALKRQLPAHVNIINSHFLNGFIRTKIIKVNLPALIVSIPIVVLPCLLAGFRADTVGIDVKVYAAETFRIMSRARSISGALAWDVDLEPGYKLLAFFSSQLSSNLSVFLFMTELMIFLPIYITAYRRAPKIPITCTVLVYMLFFYCATFNIMRQSIAAGILILAYQMYEEKKRGITVALCFGAFMFHSTTVIGVVIYACAIILGKKKNYQQMLSNIAILTMVVGSLFLFWTKLAQLLLSSGLVSERYNTYLSIFTGNVSTRHSYYFTLILDDYYAFFCRVVIAVLVIFFGRRAVKIDPNASVYWYSFLLSFLVYVIVFVMLRSTYGMRIAWVTDFSLILMLTELMAKNLKFKEIFSLRNILTFGSLVMYFMGFVVFGWHGIHPFRFSI